jgi:DNA-binding SARP family transcriptional activator/predicted ATPase
MAALKLFLFGAPQIELDGKPLSIDRSKAIALLGYLAVQGGSHTRLALATLFWPDYEQERAYAYLRRTLFTLREALGQEWIEADREKVRFAAAPAAWVDVLHFGELSDPALRSRLHAHPPEQICTACMELLEEAAALYRDGFMAGFSLRDSPEFDRWQFFQAESLRQQLGHLLQTLSTAYEDRRLFEPAIATVQRLVALDPLQETAHRQLMRLYAGLGQRGAALRQYQECLRLLSQELGVAPQRETRSLAQEIKAGTVKPVTGAVTPRLAAEEDAAPSPLVDDALAATPEGESQPLPASNFPLQPTPFIGRTHELEKIAGLLGAPDCRLLTLVGRGGAGKTRLALEAAAQAHAASRPNHAFPQGACFVALASLAASESFLPALAQALGFSFRSLQANSPEQTDQPGFSDAPVLPAPRDQLYQLIDYLRSRKMLLVLDNFEHLVSQAELLSQILAEAEQVKVIVTSRQRLNLREEWILEVGGMRCPENCASGDWESYSAVRLFEQIACRTRPIWKPSPEEMPWIVRICQLVDGLPLAIELAAGWTKMLTCQEIAGEIEQALDFLSTSLRDVPERHRSLRAVFDHSWKLLSAPQQDAYMRLSIFRGPFRLQAAQAVLSTGETRLISATTLLGLLASLSDQSLLHRAGEGRYEIHPLLRQYAAEKLAADAQILEQTRRSVCLFYADVLLQHQAGLGGSEQIQEMHLLSEDLDDIRQAWRWAVARGMWQVVEKSWLTLALLYFIRGLSREGEQDFRLAAESLRALPARQEAENGATSPLLALCLVLWGSFAGQLGQNRLAGELVGESLAMEASLDALPRAWINLLGNFGSGYLDENAIAARYRESLETFQEAGLPSAVAFSKLFYGSYLANVQEQHPSALIEEALQAFRALGDSWASALCYRNLAQVFIRLGDYEQAWKFGQASLEIFKEFGAQNNLAGVLLGLGQITTALGKYDQAKIYYQEMRRQAQEAGDRRLITVSLACLGHVHLLTAEYAPAERFFNEGLEMCQAMGDRREMGMAFSNLGNAAMVAGNLERAEANYLQSLALLEEAGERWGTTLTLNRLAGLYMQTGALEKAEATYRKALRTAQEIALPPEILEILVGLAELYARQERIDTALDLAVTVIAHPASTQAARQRAQKLLESYLPVQGSLPPARPLDTLLAQIAG